MPGQTGSQIGRDRVHNARGSAPNIANRGRPSPRPALSDGSAPLPISRFPFLSFGRSSADDWPHYSYYTLATLITFDRGGSLDQLVWLRQRVWPTLAWHARKGIRSLRFVDLRQQADARSVPSFNCSGCFDFRVHIRAYAAHLDPQHV